ncbi:hypothetical protein [Thalassotalea atypica]|uniref:hypothetical protein n=1 Tax=Thalassotalea atypica TaxID=2054316 RepID=UPI002573F144|nr:hypothetical protein [Thalassotalea atypica]
MATLEESISTKTRSVISTLRLGYEGEAGNQLASLVDLLVQAKISNENMTQITNLLKVSHQALSNRDYLFAADIIEYEIYPRIICQ